MIKTAPAARKVVDKIDAIRRTRDEYLGPLAWLAGPLPADSREGHRDALFDHCMWTLAPDALLDRVGSPANDSFHYLLYSRAEVLKMACVIGLFVFGSSAPQLVVASYKSLVRQFGPELTEVRWLLSRIAKHDDGAGMAAAPAAQTGAQSHCPQQVGLAYFLRQEVIPRPLIPFVRRRLGVRAHALRQLKECTWLRAAFRRRRSEIEGMLCEYVSKFEPA
ncbi:hypothetical protein [Variovorax sp.]|uniref:hypothetical protein n=1 Tax=Variovorax sp. TaxID=1871043 RepID=UPI002D6B5B54|nr:hypothetical protein [Variovorax sp.]HYP82978.1 hypothetical protein [Variovorax sp.]